MENYMKKKLTGLFEEKKESDVANLSTEFNPY